MRKRWKVKVCFSLVNLEVCSWVLRFQWAENVMGTEKNSGTLTTQLDHLTSMITSRYLGFTIQVISIRIQIFPFTSTIDHQLSTMPFVNFDYFQFSSLIAPLRSLENVYLNYEWKRHNFLLSLGERGDHRRYCSDDNETESTTQKNCNITSALFAQVFSLLSSN